MSLFLVFQAHSAGAKDDRVFSRIGEYEAVGRLEIVLPEDLATFGISLPQKIARRYDENNRRGISTIYSFCTATLVGPKEILTAAHCEFLVQKFKGAGLKVEFAPNSYSSTPVEIERTLQLGNPSEKRQLVDDWAVLVLQKKITVISPLKILRLTPEQYLGLEVTSVGYPEEALGRRLDGLKQTHSRCQFKTERESSPQAVKMPRLRNVYFTSCSISPGNSGGPLLALYQGEEGKALGIAGINVGGLNSFWNQLKGSSSFSEGIATPSAWILNSLLNSEL